MTIAAEHIAALIFDEQTPPKQSGVLAGISAFFGRTADTKPRHLSLREARTRMIAHGVQTETAHILTNMVQNMMADGGLHSFLARRLLNCKADMIFVNNTDWSDAHYLGVKITDPEMHIAADKDFIAGMREHFLHKASTFLNRPASVQATTRAGLHA